MRRPVASGCHDGPQRVRRFPRSAGERGVLLEGFTVRSLRREVSSVRWTADAVSFHSACVTDHMESRATAAVHAGRGDLAALGVHVPSLDASTTYPLPGIERGGDSYEVLATGGHPVVDGSLVYQRLWNPNVDRFERAVAQLEDADEAVAFATGMAAISAVLLAAVAAGTPHVVAVRPLYGGTDHLLATGLLGTRVTWARVDEIADAIEADTSLVVLESPGNPTLDLIDIAAVVRAAGDAPVMVDNTFATPVLQQPLALGATLSVHSATKFMGGHGDLMGGVVACDEAWRRGCVRCAPSRGRCCRPRTRTGCTVGCRRYRFGSRRSRKARAPSPSGC